LSQRPANFNLFQASSTYLNNWPAEELHAGLDVEVRLAEAAVARLVETSGKEFLVPSSLRTLAAALQDHMAKKSTDIAALFKEAGGGERSIAKDFFLEYLQKLPETIEHPEVEFTEEHRQALFKMMDANGAGSISEETFSGIFNHKFICVTGVTMTDVLNISVSRTTCKVIPKEVLQALGPVCKDDEIGVERVEAKIMSSGETGFVTVRSSSITYLQEVSPLAEQIWCGKGH
jgi:hypothetical protein